jgi:hypothetical protein
MGGLPIREPDGQDHPVILDFRRFREHSLFTASNNSVMLTLRGKLTASKPEELIANGELVTDTLGRGIDGADNG